MQSHQKSKIFFQFKMQSFKALGMPLKLATLFSFWNMSKKNHQICHALLQNLIPFF